jgi:phage gpG-like protein
VLSNGVEWGTNVIYAAIHQFGGIIQRGARQQTIYRRIKGYRNYNMEGSGHFQEHGRVVTGELQPGFVKKGRANFATVHAVAAHAITMPARPYLGIDADDIKEAETMLTLAIERYLAGARAA